MVPQADHGLGRRHRRMMPNVARRLSMQPSPWTTYHRAVAVELHLRQRLTLVATRPRPVHDLPRRDDRERRAAGHPARVRRRRAGPAVGRRRLQPDDGHVHHVERRASPTGTGGGACSSPASSCSAAPPSPAGLRRTSACLTVARGVQGVGAAMVNVASLALVSAAYPDPEAKAKAIGVWTGIAAIGLAIGPTRGRGAHRRSRLAEHLLRQRRSSALRPSCWSSASSPSRRIPTGRGLDLPGQLLFIVGVGALTYALIEAPHSGWVSPMILGLARRLASWCSWSFVVAELRQPRPDDGRAGVPRPRLQRRHRHHLRGALRASTARCSSSRSTSRTSGLQRHRGGLPHAGHDACRWSCFAPLAGRLAARLGGRAPTLLGVTSHLRRACSSSASASAARRSWSSSGSRRRRHRRRACRRTGDERGDGSIPPDRVRYGVGDHERAACARLDRRVRDHGQHPGGRRRSNAPRQVRRSSRRSRAAGGGRRHRRRRQPAGGGRR